MPQGRPMTYAETIAAAIADITAHGYDSAARVDYWAAEIRKAAERSMKSDADVERMVREAMTEVYRKQVEAGGVIRANPGVSAFTIEQVKPELRAELQRRIAASIDLIKINRPQAIAKTEQRFRGWATSVPAGGSRTVQKGEEKANIKKALSSEPYEVRRVIIDQGQKLANAINTTVAVGGGAIAAEWHAHRYTPESRARPEHARRNGEIFLIKGSWADQAGFVKLAGHQWTDQVEQPSELPFCSCSWRHIFSLRSLPSECLTEKGKDALEEARAKIAADR